ncbi:toxic anion resistance protein [Acidovorax sp.]|uniref:toxic anion resistance protein n=1 Tax=Acidovorax sp. TaxID=1872122 RepID=UPI00391F3C52
MNTTELTHEIEQTSELATSKLAELGLQASDTAEILSVAQRINLDAPNTIAEFGRDVAEHTSQYADNLLDQVKNGDLDDAGAKLAQVVSVARSLNLGPMSDQRSRIPVIGGLIDKLRLKGGDLVGRFDTTRVQIEKLLTEVQTTQAGLAERNRSLESMYAAVVEEHRILGIHVVAGRIRLKDLSAHSEELRKVVGNDPSKLQHLVDCDALTANLQKRVGDLTVLQQSAFQSLPSIRIIQSNNQLLIDKFHTIREVTVPAWKRQFVLLLSLNEQRNAVDLADTIDNTTNDLLKSNAALLHRNSVETAKANQRLVIDVDTLQKVQNTLIQTVDDVLKIQREGVQKRADASMQIEIMRRD